MKKKGSPASRKRGHEHVSAHKKKDKSQIDAVTKLSMAGNYYSKISPGLSRFFMCVADSYKGNDLPDSYQYQQMVCQFCGSILVPGNHSVRVKPKAKPNNKVMRLLKRVNKGEMLGRFHKNLMRKHKRETNSIVVHCYICGKDDSFPGGGRDIKRPKKLQKAKKKSKKGVVVHSNDLKQSQSVNKKGEKYSLDSGKGESLSSVAQDKSLSLSSMSSAGVSRPSLNTTPTLLSPTTNTPKARKSHPALLNSPLPSASVSFASAKKKAGKKSLKGKNTTLQGTNTQKNKKNKKNHITVLQKLLHDQNKKDGNKGNSLQQFLNAL